MNSKQVEESAFQAKAQKRIQSLLKEKRAKIISIEKKTVKSNNIMSNLEIDVIYNLDCNGTLAEFYIYHDGVGIEVNDEWYPFENEAYRESDALLDTALLCLSKMLDGDWEAARSLKHIVIFAGKPKPL
jgi:hypothetical protein